MRKCVITMILGPRAAGKSTLVNCIAKDPKQYDISPFYIHLDLHYYYKDGCKSNSAVFKRRLRNHIKRYRSVVIETSSPDILKMFYRVYRSDRDRIRRRYNVDCQVKILFLDTPVDVIEQRRKQRTIDRSTSNKKEGVGEACADRHKLLKAMKKLCLTGTMLNTMEEK